MSATRLQLQGEHTEKASVEKGVLELRGLNWFWMQQGFMEFKSLADGY